MNNDEILVNVENVSKKFCRRLRKSLWYGVHDIIGELLCRNNTNTALRPDEFWALHDISFELKRGECLGLIGRNGAGKSTLLKLLSGLIKPDKGYITIRGRVGALIELGAGFNPILTGRENIYVNAAVLGISKKQVDRVINQIVDFAELNEFIDTPVQNYSSGMRVKLGFAIATQLQPEILLIDEILAVGDRQFRTKCFDHIAETQKKTAIILVSHNLPQIARVCNKVIVLDRGKKIYEGTSEEGIQRYFLKFLPDRKSFVKEADKLKLKDIRLSKDLISWKDSLRFIFEFDSERCVKNCIMRVVFYDDSDMGIAEWKSINYNKKYSIRIGRNVISETLNCLNFRNGRYFVTFILSSEKGIDYMILAHCYASFTIQNGVYGNTICQI